MEAAHLTDHAKRIVEIEREALVARFEEMEAFQTRLAALLEAATAEVEAGRRALRRMDEILGRAPQIPIEDLDAELTGRRLREVAVAVLRRSEHVDRPIHYIEWQRLVEDIGVTIGGKNPTATFLTQITQSAEVESVRPRSGLFRLKSA